MCDIHNLESEFMYWNVFTQTVVTLWLLKPDVMCQQHTHMGIKHGKLWL